MSFAWFEKKNKNDDENTKNTVNENCESTALPFYLEASFTFSFPSPFFANFIAQSFCLLLQTTETKKVQLRDFDAGAHFERRPDETGFFFKLSELFSFIKSQLSFLFFRVSHEA